MGELGTNFAVQYTDFSIKFENITKNGAAFNFSEVGKWIFSMGKNVSSVPVYVKNSSSDANLFIINTGNQSVTVRVNSTGISNDYGQFYVGLFAETSGSITGHLSKYITIEQNIRPTGV